MSEKIIHDGVIESMNGKRVTVRIARADACSSCQARGHCGSTIGEDRLIELSYIDQRDYNIGDHVVVEISVSEGRHAVLLGFGVPLMLIMVVAFVAIGLGVGDGMAALLSCVSLLPYYLLLWLFRQRVQRHFTFKIKE